jgi:hypothetical protein
METRCGFPGAESAGYEMSPLGRESTKAFVKRSNPTSYHVASSSPIYQNWLPRFADFGSRLARPLSSSGSFAIESGESIHVP